MLGEAARAAYTGMALAAGALPDQPVAGHWTQWRAKALEHCRHAAHPDLPAMEKWDVYPVALRWLTGVLSQRVLDAELCFWAGMLLAERTTEEAAAFGALAARLSRTCGTQFSDHHLEVGGMRCDMMLERHPTSARLHLWRGATYLSLGQYDQADRHLNRSLELDGKSTYPYCWTTRELRADALDALGQDDRADALRRRAEELRLSYRPAT